MLGRKKHVPGTVPNATLRRKLLYSPTLSPDEADRIATDLMEAEHFTDALGFVERSANAELLAALRAKARELGDYFLYQACCRVEGRDLEPSELRALAEKARARGMLHFARQALESAGAKDEAEAVESELARLLPPPEGQQGEDGTPA